MTNELLVAMNELKTLAEKGLKDFEEEKRYEQVTDSTVVYLYKLELSIHRQKNERLDSNPPLLFFYPLLPTQATFYRKDVCEAMNRTRCIVDSLELIVDDKLWPFPKYQEMLFTK